MADLSSYINIKANVVTTGNLTATGNVTGNSILSTTGNVTGNYFIGNGSQLTGITTSYGNSNVATFLAAYGSNTVSTSGNITSGNLLTSGSISVTGNVSTANYFVGNLLGTTVSTTGNVTAANFIGNISITGNVTGTSSNVTLVAGSYNWTFDNTGNVTLPSGGDLIFSANTTLTSVSNGNITIDPNGTGQLVVTAITPAAFGNTLSVAGNVTTGNYFVGNLIGTTVSVTGNITSGNLRTGGLLSATGNATAGNLIASNTLYGNVDVIVGDQANSSATKTRMVSAGAFSYIQTGNGTIGSTGNVVFAPYASITQKVVIDTSSGNLSAVGNIASGNLLTAGVVSATGFVYGVELTSTNSTGNEGGQINLSVPAANTTLGGTTVTVDIYQNRIRFFEGSVNAKGAYIDLANCASGVGTNLVNRASTIAGANTAVTLDNLQARVGGSPTRLYINTVSGNLTGAGDTQTLLSGSVAVSSWINVPIGQGAGNAFAMSGALSSNGDTAILSLIDQGTGSGMWRITGMIANTTANLYGVTIERLV